MGRAIVRDRSRNWRCTAFLRYGGFNICHIGTEAGATRIKYQKKQGVIHLAHGSKTCSGRIKLEETTGGTKKLVMFFLSCIVFSARLSQAQIFNMQLWITTQT